MPRWWNRLLGWTFSVSGGFAMFVVSMNMIDGINKSSMPAPAQLALATVVFGGGVALLKLRKPGTIKPPKGAEITATGEVSYDRQVLQAVRACEGRATAERVASLLGIEEQVAERELRTLEKEGACRSLEDGTFIFPEFERGRIPGNKASQ